MRTLCKWLSQKKNEDTGFVQFLKLAYSIGQQSWLHAIISAILGILIPYLLDREQFIPVFFTTFFLILDIVYASICTSYQNTTYTQRKFASEILLDQSSLLKSIVIEMENNIGWRNKIFKTVSDLVCEKIYRNFKEVFKCETRVAIEYIFQKNMNTSQPIKHVKMSGRRSSKRSTVKKSLALDKRKNYYSYKIFINNNSGINILTESDIKDDSIWYHNPSTSTDIKKYVGIAVSVYDETEVKFILEIDFLDDFTFGNNNNDDDIKTFINQYLISYINIVSIAYLLNLNSKKQIPEV